VLDSLDGALFGAPVTIIARPEQFPVAYNLSLAAGPANVVTVSEKVATQLNFTSSECALFRQDDHAFATFPCNLPGYKSNIAPLFSYYNEHKLQHSRDLIFAFHSKEPEPIATAFLAELGRKYRNFHFVYAPRGETYAITNFLKVVFHHPYTNIAIINYSAGFHYDLSTLVTREQFDEEPFNATVWRRRIRDIVRAVRGNKIPRVYQSDYEGERESGNLHAVVGTNYLQYAMNESADVFVMYHKPTCGNCQAIYRDCFQKFAAEVERLGNITYEFIHIDVDSNSIPEGFPVWAPGSIAIYPREWKQVKILPLESYEFMLWFASKYASCPHPFPFEFPDNATLDKAQERMEDLALYMNESMRNVLTAVMIDVKADIYMRDLFIRNPDADKPWPKRENETKEQFELWKPEYLEELRLEREADEAARAAAEAAMAAEAARNAEL
jgi:hypothetical protein